MATVALPISNLVNIQVSVSAAAAQAQNTTSLLILTNNSEINTRERIHKYAGLSDVGGVFGANSIEYKAATAWFGQVPSPTDILIGKWAKTPTSGTLNGANLTQSQQEIDQWTQFTGAKFVINVCGFGPFDVGPMNFANETNLNGVASVINNAFQTAGVAATAVWTGSRFRFTANVVGSSSNISFLTPIDPADANDISGNLGMRQGQGGFAVDGIEEESAEDAVNTMDLLFGYQWYAIVVPEADEQDQLTCAEAVQAMATKHFFAATTQDADTLDAQSTSDLPYLMSQQAMTHCAVQYSSTNAFAVCSLMGRILTTDYTQNNSVITLMYKQQPGITAEYLNRQQMDTLLAKNCNVFVAYQGGALIIQPGTTSATNQFIDTVVGLDNLAIDVQMAIFNLLYTTTTKVPQTDAGMNQIMSAAENVLLQYVANGLIGPGTWNDVGFGKLTSGEYLDKGYYIYCPPLSQQSQADRAARMAGPMKIGVKLAGAIHTVDATIEVNP